MLFCWSGEHLQTSFGFCWSDTVNSLRVVLVKRICIKMGSFVLWLAIEQPIEYDRNMWTYFQAGLEQMKFCSASETKKLKEKGTLMQIWKSTNIPVFIWKKYVEDFAFKYLLLFERCVREKCEKFVYKHSETI